MHASLLRSVAVLAIVAPVPAFANVPQPPVLSAAAMEAADDAQLTGREIIVTGRLDGYRTVETTTGTKTSTPILDVPQSVSVVTAQQVADQSIRSMADLVRLIPGVSAGQGEGHRDQITLRGNNSTADFFVDGLRDDAQYYRSFYNVDRIEVHKGPNAMIFGRGGGGGLVNRISKGALIGETQVGGAVSVDTFGSWYGSVDSNISLSPEAALRVNALYEELANHRDGLHGHRWAVNPVVGAELADGRVRVQLGYEHVDDDRGVDRGIPAARVGSVADPAGPARGLTRTFFGRRDSNDATFKGDTLRGRAEADLSDALTFSLVGQYGDYDKGYANIYPVAPIGGTAAAPTTVVEAYQDLTARDSFIGQANLVWEGSTGGIGHTLLIGAEYTDQDTASERINGFFGASGTGSADRRVAVAVARNPVIPPVRYVAGPAGNGNRAAQSALSQVSAYIQDQIKLSDSVEIIAGVRYDRFDLTVTNVFTGQRFERVDHLWSPRAGLVFKPVPNASLYASYSKSFLPQSGDQFNSLDLTSAALKPETFDNYELGAKWDVIPGLSLTAAVYQLDRGNTRAPGPVAGTVVLTGEQRTRGVEVGVVGRPTPEWQVSAGYALTDAEVTRTTAAAPAGRTVAQVPRHQLSLWNRYDLSDVLGIGLGVFHQSSQFATISNSVRLPAYTRVDAAVFVALTDRIEAQVNVENLTNTRYFPVAHNDQNISTGAPINARFTLKARF